MEYKEQVETENTIQVLTAVSIHKLYTTRKSSALVRARALGQVK